VRTRLVSSKATVRLLHAILVALALFTVGSGARAAVPLCSEDGRTMPAPPIVKPSSGRAIESAGDCEHPGDNQRTPLELADTPPRAVPVRGVLPAAPRLARLDVETDVRRALPAAIDGVFRPPRPG
jgi:hypothetical protein